MSRRTSGALLAGLLLFSGGLGAQGSPPPRGLQQVDDHWTAWTPPASFPEGAQVYAIERGDTLWALGERFLGDPYLWPQIWELNQYILDAHWIYPGDPLQLPGTAAGRMAEGVVSPPLEEGVGVPGGPGSGVPGGPMADAAARAADFVPSGTEPPVPLGHESDIYCSGYIGDPKERFPYTIVHSEYEFLNPTLNPQGTSSIQGIYGRVDTQKFGLGLSDIVYLDGGRADGLSAGELLTAVSPRDKVHHPKSRRPLGRYYQYLGRVRVLSAQEDEAIGEIVLSCYPISVGTELKLFEPEPVPLRRMTPIRPVNYPPRAEQLEGSPMIVLAQHGLITLGAGSLIYMDRGFEDEVAPGDIYTVFRSSGRGLPPIVVGEVGVLSVQGRSSLGRVLRSRYALYVGDALLLK